MQRIRLTFSKTEPLRYTSNLDMQKIWERYLRRAGLPVMYSQGFHPQPKIQQACPLPLGFLSDHEIVDFWLDFEEYQPEAILNQLTAQPQPGIEIQTIENTPPYSPTLQTQVATSDYKVIILSAVNPEELKIQLQRVMAADSLIRERRNKKYDLRPLIEDISIVSNENSDQVELFMRLSVREGATGRPDEVLAEMGIDPFSARIIRTQLHFIDQSK